MYIYRKYDKEKALDRAWYKSSNILYSECDDIKDSLKTLRVTFKSGATYEYHDVDVHDYVMFLNGGLNGSSGNAFFKYIKNKYQFTRLPDKDPIQIEKDLETTKKEKTDNTQEKTL